MAFSDQKDIDRGSVYSADGGQGDYGITGSILLGIWYSEDSLFVQVVKADNLAKAKPGGVCNPYVKICLLPDRFMVTKSKTAIRNSNNPTYNEALRVKLKASEIEEKTLQLSIWDCDKYGANLFLGELRLKLSSLDLTNSDAHWYTLKERKHKRDIINRGEIKVSIMYNDNKHSLFVRIIEATGLIQMDPELQTNSFVRLLLLPETNSPSKKTTQCVQSNLNPVWNEDFEFEPVTLEELKTSRILELSVWHNDEKGSYNFVGCVRLGPFPNGTNDMCSKWMDSTNTEADHWAEMLAQPGEMIERYHELRHSIANRFDEQSIIEDSSVYGDSFVDGEVQDKSDSARLTVSLKFDYHEPDAVIFFVWIKNAKNLPAMWHMDYFVDVFLIRTNSKGHRDYKKTVVVKENQNPEWNEVFQYGEITYEEFCSECAIELVVRNQNMYLSSDLIGGLHIGPAQPEDQYIKGIKLTEEEIEHWEYMLSHPNEWVEICHILKTQEFRVLTPRKSLHTSPRSLNAKSIRGSPVPDSPYSSRIGQLYSGITASRTSSDGQLIVSLLFEVTSRDTNITGNLHVGVEKALDLRCKLNNGIYAKCRILPLKSFSSASKKTLSIKSEENPAWNEVLTFGKQSMEELQTQKMLEISLWDRNNSYVHKFIGRVCLGPRKMISGKTSSLLETEHWESVFKHPGEWVKNSHKLKQA